jgi:DNA repair exonuclease SbcCD ATPase subunit
MNMKQLFSRISYLDGKRKEFQKEHSSASQHFDFLTSRQKDLEVVGSYLKNHAAEMQRMVQMNIESLVQQLLSACFPEQGYIFQMQLKESRGVLTSELVLLKEGKELDPVMSCGGGVVDVISIALRFGILLVSNVPKVLFLDEPFKFLSKSLRPAISQLIYDLANQYGITIVMISHDPDFIKASNKVFEVSQSKGISKVEIAG